MKSIHHLSIALVHFIFILDLTSCTIHYNNNGYYIGVFDDTNKYNWFESKKYCMVEFGSTLASIHSDADYYNLLDARIDQTESTWVGLYDINWDSGDGNWRWSDGTDFNYNVPWEPGEPNNGGADGNEDCGELYSNETFSSQFNDVDCSRSDFSQFICNLEQNWRPIFKLTTDVTDFGGENNSYFYYLNGNSTYDNLGEDNDYYYNISGSSVDYNNMFLDNRTNYRSLLIDDWSYLHDNNLFDKVLLSVHRDEELQQYFVFDASDENLTSWMTQDNTIESSYLDAIYYTHNIWGVKGDHDAGRKRYWMIWSMYGSCPVDTGWLVVTEQSYCGVWDPNEGRSFSGNSQSPQIRYSKQTTDDGLYQRGYMDPERYNLSYGSTNTIGHYMVVWINIQNSTEITAPIITEYKNYISVYFYDKVFNWFEAKDFCMRNFGSSLASIHSSSDESDVINSRFDNGTYEPNIKTWIGMNDIKTDSKLYDQSVNGSNVTWQWSDGTPYDYSPTWKDSGEPSGFWYGKAEDCIALYPQGTLNDFTCNSTYHTHQFVCGEEVYWRPLFKIVNNGSDLGGVDNVYEYWVNGSSSFDRYDGDIEFIRDEFSASDGGGDNYRSLLIDDWIDVFNDGSFDRIKVSLFKNGTEVVYFTFYATNDSESWFNQDNMIDSSYYDIFTENAEIFSMNGDPENERYFEIFKSDNCSNNDATSGWIVVSQNDVNTCGSVWSPIEGTTISQIRYSTYVRSSNNLKYGASMTNSLQNEIADSFVIYINADINTTVANDTTTQSPTTTTTTADTTATTSNRTSTTSHESTPTATAVYFTESPMSSTTDTNITTNETSNASFFEKHSLFIYTIIALLGCICLLICCICIFYFRMREKPNQVEIEMNSKSTLNTTLSNPNTDIHTNGNADVNANGAVKLKKSTTKTSRSFLCFHFSTKRTTNDKRRTRLESQSSKKSLNGQNQYSEGIPRDTNYDYDNDSNRSSLHNVNINSVVGVHPAISTHHKLSINLPDKKNSNIRAEMIKIDTVSSPDSEEEFDWGGNDNDNGNNNGNGNNINAGPGNTPRDGGEQARSSIMSETHENENENESDSDSDGGLYNSGVNVDVGDGTTRGDDGTTDGNNNSTRTPLKNANINDGQQNIIASANSSPNLSVVAVVDVLEGMQDLKSNPENEGMGNPNIESVYVSNINARSKIGNKYNQKHPQNMSIVSDVSSIFNQSAIVAGFDNEKADSGSINVNVNISGNDMHTRSNTNANTNTNRTTGSRRSPGFGSTKTTSTYTKRAINIRDRKGRRKKVPRSTVDLIQDMNESQRSLQSNASTNTVSTVHSVSTNGATVSSGGSNYRNNNNNNNNNNNRGAMITSEGKSDNNNGALMVMTDVSNFSLWTSIELSTWIQSELMQGGFDIESISSFMRQFNELEMTGKVLKLWIGQSGPDKKKLLNKFQNRIKFNPKSTIWDILIESIWNIQ